MLTANLSLTGLTKLSRCEVQQLLTQLSFQL
jgi:hypothetical protein